MMENHAVVNEASTTRSAALCASEEMVSHPDSLWSRLFVASLSPVPVHSLIVFRIGFGLIAAWWAIDYLRSGEVEATYVSPRFHFSYWLFDGIRPWPGGGPYLHFVAMIFFALCIALGLAYRLAAILFALGFTLIFLWDRTNYQNHYYLMLLLAWILAALPLNRGASLDAINNPQLISPVVPRWMLWLVRFQVGIPYVYGGLAKFNADWLAGAGLRDYLITKSSMSVLGEWLATNDAAVWLAWSGLLFDLSVVPLLLIKRTRAAAYVATVLFHLSNHYLFSIHIFPWFMMMATTVFFEPDWPSHLLRVKSLSATEATHEPIWWTRSPSRYRWGIGLLTVYVASQLLVPFRHYAYPGDAGWHERGHTFAWRMMLRTKRCAMRVYMTDPILGETWNADLLQWMTLRQVEVCARDPELILELAHRLRDDYHRQTGNSPEVRCLVLCCYNGRKPQLLLDPKIDLAREPRGFYARAWICPQSEPLPTDPWQRPVKDWQRLVVLPALPIITRGPHGEKIAADKRVDPKPRTQ